MFRREFTLTMCVVLSVAFGLTGLSSCGGGGGGDSRSSTKPRDEVTITPPGNRAPVSSQAFENIVIPVESGSKWESQPLSKYFSDPDGNALRFIANTENALVATVEIIDGGFLIVRPQSSGTTKIEVTATNPSGHSVSQVFSVSTTDNRPPTASQVFKTVVLILSDDDPSLSRWMSGYLDIYFSDTGVGPFSYKWLSSDENIAIVRIDRNLRPTEQYPGTSSGFVVEARRAGTATVTVTATDTRGAITTRRLSIVVIDHSKTAGPPPPDHSDTPAGASRIDFGTPVIGDLHSSNDVDYFFFEIANPSVVDIHFYAATGTKITLLDSDNNIIVSGITQSIININDVKFLKNSKVWILVEQPVKKVENKFSIVVKKVPIYTKIIKKQLKLSRVRLGHYVDINISDYIDCRYVRGDNNKIINNQCELEFIVGSGFKLPKFEISVEVGSALRIAAKCNANIGTFNFPIRLVTKVFGVRIPILEFNFETSPAKPGKCSPSLRPGKKLEDLSIHASPGDKVSINFKDYIWDPREGKLRFGIYKNWRTEQPKKLKWDNVSISPKELKWSKVSSVPEKIIKFDWIPKTPVSAKFEIQDTVVVDIAKTAEVGKIILQTIGALSLKHDVPLHSKFVFNIFVGCTAQILLNGRGYLPSQSFVDKLVDPRYTGECENGRAQGQGRFTAGILGERLTYEGNWENGEPSGEGKWHIETFGRTMSYEGAWIDGRPHGLGKAKIIYKIGRADFEIELEGSHPYIALDISKYTSYEYEGNFIDGLPGGLGKLHTFEKSRGEQESFRFLKGCDRSIETSYVGNFLNGLQDGRGKETSVCDNGYPHITYHGDFKSGDHHGKGVRSINYSMGGDWDLTEGVFRYDHICNGTEKRFRGGKIITCLVRNAIYQEPCNTSRRLYGSC